MKEKKVASLKIVFEDGDDYSLACEVGLDKDELAKYIERAFKPEPAEPLIKDEKIRKAVRAWAEAMGVKTVEYDDYWQSFRRDNSTICFRDNGDYYFEKLENGKTYTIAELCGEEKE